MEILSIPVNEINPAEYNPRKDLQPGDPEYEKLKKSIMEFDMVEPLVWNKQTGNLVGGHQRLKILEEMGTDKVDVSVVDLSPVKEKALNIALNKIQGEWDFPKLKDLLQELDSGDFDMEITGFDESEIEQLMTQFHEPGEGLTEDDALPEKVATVCKTGDLWQLGDHRLLCGDATKQEDVERLMGGEKAYLMITDPPYGVNYEADGINPRWSSDGKDIPNDNLRNKSVGRKGRLVRGHQFYSRGGRKMDNDDLEGDEQYPFWINAMKGWPLNGDAYIFCPSGPNNLILALAIEEAGIEQHQWLIWVKNKLVMGRAHYHYRHEHLFYGWKGKSSWNGSRDQDSIWQFERPNRSPEHPTMKPVAICGNAINLSSSVGNIVIDPFGGSGSTLIACEKLGRRCFMMEIDEHYCDVIIQRWQEFTGLKAEKLNGK